MAHEQMNGASISPAKAADFESKPDPTHVPAALPRNTVAGSYKPQPYGLKANSADPTAIPLRTPNLSQDE